jgi:hypothetical protein
MRLHGQIFELIPVCCGGFGNEREEHTSFRFAFEISSQPPRLAQDIEQSERHFCTHAVHFGFFLKDFQSRSGGLGVMYVRQIVLETHRGKDMNLSGFDF